MKTVAKYVLGLFVISAASGCSAIHSDQFAELEKETKDYCTKFNHQNIDGKKVSVASFTLKVVEVDEQGNKVETSRVVSCS